MDAYLDSQCAKLDITMLTRAKAFDLEPGEIKDGRFCLDPDDPTGCVIVWGVEADDRGRPEGIALIHRTPGSAPVEQAVLLTTTACHFGGVRHWFICPAEGCGRRAAVLYRAPGGAEFACRHCAQVIYAVTRETPHERLARREAKLQSRLGGAASLGGPRPRGMHKKTFRKLSTLRAVMSLDRHTAVLDAMLKQEGLAGVGSDEGPIEAAVRRMVSRNGA